MENISEQLQAVPEIEEEEKKQAVEEAPVEGDHEEIKQEEEKINIDPLEMMR